MTQNNKEKSPGRKRYSLKEHMHDIITGQIINIVWIPILACLTWLFQFGYSVYSSFLTNSPKWAVAFFPTAISTICLIAIIVLYLKTKKMKAVEQEKSNAEKPMALTDFRIETVEAELNVRSREKMFSTITFDMYANHDGIDSFDKTIFWTGSSYNGTELKETNGDYSLDDVGGNDGFRHHRVMFGRTLDVQDHIKFTLKTSVEDMMHSMEPFYVYIVKHQIKRLTVRIVLAKGCAKRMKNFASIAYWDTARQMRIKLPERIKKRVIGGNDTYEIVINNPTLLYRYGIEWEFTD